MRQGKCAEKDLMGIVCFFDYVMIMQINISTLGFPDALR